MTKTFEIDMQGFRKALDGLHKISGKSFKDVLKSEAGQILSGAMRNTPKAKVKNIVRHNMPEGYKPENVKGNNIGEKLVIHRFGKVYHIGKPILKGYQKRETHPSLKGKSQKPKGAPKHWKPKRGGKIYEKPFPKQAWMRRQRWEEFVQESNIKTFARVANRGMTAAQFGFMADMLGIKITKNRPGYLQTEHLRNKLKAFLTPKYQNSEAQRLGFKTQIILESKGLKQTARTGAGQTLVRQVNARARFFQKAVKKGWINDIKKFMPKNYPLLFE